ncbi:hypothetical protein AGMMS50233_09710 [Endomicrobiia bacterium]|nr:hypothetical protein AGMMS50233_09710 [Endomicrobiia bacterium]
MSTSGNTRTYYRKTVTMSAKVVDIDIGYVRISINKERGICIGWK